MQPPLTVIIADDHETYRKGLSSIIGQLPDVSVLSLVSDTGSLIETLKNYSPQLVMLNAQLPPHNALEVCRYLWQHHPAAGIIVINHNCSTWLTDELLNAGAGMVLFENASEPEIQLCLLTMQRKKEPFSREGKEVNFVKANVQPHPKLNEKEILLIQLLYEELKTEEIARRMFLSPYTVENMRKALLRKLGVKNIVGIVKYAIRLGIVGV